MKQDIVCTSDCSSNLDSWLEKKNSKVVLLVANQSIKYQKDLSEYFDLLGKRSIQIVLFSNFQPNPLYENVQEGIKLFREKQCDTIITVGGGSAIDVAKCIKLFSHLPGDGEDASWLKAEYVKNNIPFLVIPTTAGTGSEATRFAVIYYKGEKQSITSDNIIPDTVLLDSNTLISLPIYQKKTSMCDALCHAIESFWSINSTNESKELSRRAIELIIDNMGDYLENVEKGRRNMLLAANIAGKAINITHTTAGHAMCYKITSLFKSAHGHAAMLCDRVLFPWMIENTDKCIDPRGEQYLKGVLCDIAHALGCETPEKGAEKLGNIFRMLELEIPMATEPQFEEMKTSVNPERLKNHPITLDVDTIDMLYHRILNGESK